MESRIIMHSSCQCVDCLCPKFQTCIRKIEFDDANKIILDFFKDVQVAYGYNKLGSINENDLDWPDLVVTFKKAFKYLSDNGLLKIKKAQ